VRIATGVSLFALMVTVDPRSARARQRHRFEPTDLEMEDSGLTEVDVQVGMVRGDGPWRTVVPDVELDVGLTPNVELDVDGAYAVEGPDDGQFALDHPAPENVWIAVKLGLYDTREDDSDTTAWAIGAQLGPKLPVANDAHGIGYEALVIAGYRWRESHVVLNLGGLIDPGLQVSSQRPEAVEGGLDVDVQFGRSPWSVTAELAGAHFFSADSDQLNGTAGLTFAASEMLDLSLVGLVGFLKGGDRGGVLLGISPKFALWK
jgi:hypothetical protein